jgi:exosortase A
VGCVVAAAGVVLAIYHSTLATMAGLWFRSATFAHGVMILPVAAALLFRQRGALARSVPTISWWAAPALLVCVAAWLLGTLVQADVVSQFAMMAMTPAILLLTLGPSTVRSIRFPILFSMLAVPVGEFLVAPMMDLTANGSVRLLHLTGVPVYQDRWLLSIPAGDFQVADACSGVRYLVGAVTTGVLFAYFFFRSLRKRILFICFTAILTIIANVLRAYIIILLAHLSDMRLAVGADHFVYGWFLFSVLLMGIFAVGLRFADGHQSGGSDRPLRFVETLRVHGRRHLLAAAAGIAILVIGPMAFGRLSAVAADEGLAVPVRLAGAQLAGDIPRPRWLQADAGWYMRHLAFNGGTPFEMHIFLGRPGPGGRDLTALRERLASSEATLVTDEETAVRSPLGPLTVREMRLQEQARTLMVGYWFEVDSGRTANPVTAKLMEIRTMLTGEHKKPALIAVVLDTKGLDQPGASLHAIIAETAAGVASCLRQLRPVPQCESFAPSSG